MSVEQRFRGIPVSGGVAVAPACLLNEYRHNPAAIYTVPAEEITREQERLRAALDDVARQLEKLKSQVAERVGRAEAEIFTAQKMIVEDAGLRNTMAGMIAGE